jgi:glycosyltransferase involved in cell wall biosynthesis
LFATGDSVTTARLEYVFDRAPGSASINDPILDTTHTLFALRDARERFDVLHVHAPFSALAASIEIGLPVVHTLHGSFTDDMTRLYGLAADRAWYVAISQAQRGFDPDLRYAGVVYNGIDMQRYPLWTEKEDFVLFLGRADPDKGWVRAVEAARLAGVRLVSAVKIAHPREQQEWDERVKPILPADAEVLGEISHEEKVSLLERAKAVLFPIDWPEPFGLVMTEAMACGTPVIATPRGSVPEVIEDGVTGWIVDVEDYAAQAAERLSRLDEIDPHACRARVERLFSKEAMVRGYDDVFHRVAEGVA